MLSNKLNSRIIISILCVLGSTNLYAGVDSDHSQAGSSGSSSVKAEAARPKNFLEARHLDELDYDDRFRFGLGYQSIQTQNMGSMLHSLGLVLDFSPTHAFELYAALGASQANTLFEGGLIYRATLSGDRLLGLHLGLMAAVGEGASGDITAKAGPLLGIHTAVFQFHNLQFSLDAGPIYSFNGVSARIPRIIEGMLILGFHYYF